MDSSNLPPPNHGGPIGDVWFRGLPRPDHLLTALKEDFYILVVGCMMKYIRLEKEDENGLSYKARIVKVFNHGVDGIAAISGSQFRDVYALAEKRLRPRIFIFQIHKTDRGELEPHYMHSLKHVHSWDIRSMQFISKELFVILTGIPTFNVVLFRWNTNEEIMSSMSTGPNLFSKLLVSPLNPCHWIEHGEDYMYVYEMASLNRTDVVRTSVNLPSRKVMFDHADPLMGRRLAIKIVSACWTNKDEFFVLDEQYCIHKYVPSLKVLQWTCSLGETFLGCDVTQIVPYAEGLAAITKDGWFLNYGEIQAGSTLEVTTAFKLSSRVLRYIQFPEIPETFFAITESKGAIEGVSSGLLRDPFSIPDIMFSNILSCCFIEPQSDYMAIVTNFGKVVILECNTGEPIAKWKLPFKVVGVASHPVLPFMFCGTTYGCVNVLDIRNLKDPKLINRRFFTREPNCSIEKFGFVSQGRYVVSADTVNNRVFVQYGYPFMSFDFIDTARVPARISHICVPGCGKDDNKFQIFMSGKSKSDEGVIAFVINFSLRNDRIMVIASQIVDQPVTALCLTPMRKYSYGFYPLKKGLGVVPFCDDNQWLNLQEPEHFVDAHFKHDVSFMAFNGDKLYTFGEDGMIQVHEAPVIPKKKTQLPMVLKTLAHAQTHCYSYRGIKEGIVSLDGSQVIAIGHDGTFCRVRFFPKPKEPDWQVLGYERSKLIDYQVGTYLIDQEFYKAGDEFVDRIADIKIRIDEQDPINFYDPGEETSDEEEEPNPELPKPEKTGEKLRYGPKKSFKGSTRKKIKVKFGQNDSSKSTSSSDQSKKQIKLRQSLVNSINEAVQKEIGDPNVEAGQTSGGESTRADDISSLRDITHEMDAKSEKSDGPSLVSEPKKVDIPEIVADDASTSTAPPTAEPNQDSFSENTDVKRAEDEGLNKDEPRGPNADPKTAQEAVPPSSELESVRTRADEDQSPTTGSDNKEGDSNASITGLKKDSSDSAEHPKPAVTEVLLHPQAMKDAKSSAEVGSMPNPNLLSPAGVDVLGSYDDNASMKQSMKSGASTAAQMLMSKVKEKSKPQHEQKPGAPDEPSTATAKLPENKATTAALKSGAPTSMALKGVLTERTRRKQMAKDKSKNEKEKKEKKPKEEAPVEPEPEVVAEPVVEEVVEEPAVEEVIEEEVTTKKGLKMKGFGEMKKAAKVLGMLFGKKKELKSDDSKERRKSSKKKIKKFQGGQAGKMLAAAQSTTSTKIKAPPSRTARNRMGQAKLVKQILDDENLADPLGKLKKKKGKKSVMARKTMHIPGLEPDVFKKNRKQKQETEQSEASKALMMEAEITKNLEISILHDPAIYLLPEKETAPYSGQDVDEVLTVHHAVRRKEYTEPEFFTQFEKTLLYRQHIPKAQALRHEFEHFTELMDELMMFNKQRELGHQVEMKEFNFDEDREPRLQERAQKMKKIANIQMVVRNKLRHAKINAMKQLLWDQFETKGMTLMGFRKRLEVSNYPLPPESDFYEGAVREAISWRRLELRLELEEEETLKEGNEHALRVLHHEMQYVTPARKRQYMKSIMNIDPNARFEDYEASDSEQSDEEFFAKVFEELGIEIPQDRDALRSGTTVSAIEGLADGKTSSKAVKAMTGAASASKAASKFLKKKTETAKKPKQDFKMLLQKTDSSGEPYVEKLKKWLLQEESEEPLRPITADSSMVSTEASTRIQSRRDFMMNIKPSKNYLHPKGIFGPKGAASNAVGYTEVETLMEPHRAVSAGGDKARDLDGQSESRVKHVDYALSEVKPSRLRAVIKQRKKMKFTRTYDVLFEEEEDVSGPEDEAVIDAQRQKFESWDDEYKERFDSINNIFYGSCLADLTDMYQFKPAIYRYTQFELQSRHELWRHHYITMAGIYQMKKFFNRQFELLRNAKGYNLRKMADRNERIREIYYYLKVDLDILDEKWKLQEDPSQIFTVTKDEVPVEKYLTVEQRRLEEIRRLEDLARRRTRMAEFRKKALYAMMDNRLEVKREEILINDIPKPPFMLEKDPLEFSLEEYLQSLQYAEAVEALEIARVELIKELEEELGRLYRANAMDINTIDLRVMELSLMKYQFHQNFLMEETRILRAVRQLRMMEELDREQRRIVRIVQELKSSMKGSQNMASQLEHKKIVCEEDIAKFAEQEKDLERNFRRDLGDVGPYFEFFYKSYKKKPKLSLKGLSKADTYETMVRALRADNIRTFARENGEVARLVVMAIYDLEDPMLMPKDCPRSYWDKFNRVRRERLICEYQTKALMAEIERVTNAINEYNRKEAEGTAAIAAVLAVVAHKNDMKTYFVANTEFQMVLGKGQCEIDCWDFNAHCNATIILIDNVEKLNQRIYDASDKLIKEMSKTAGVHRDIKEIEWRFLVVEMATKDLKKVQHDVTCFKPTKKLLEVLRKGINLDSMHTDRLVLVEYLKATYIKYQKIFLRTKSKLLHFYQRQTKRRHDGNDQYRGNIFDQTESLVASQVTKVSPELQALNNNDLEKRTVLLMLRGYLNRKIIRLCNEVERLEEELEKQYQRTYPVL